MPEKKKTQLEAATNVSREAMTITYYWGEEVYV